MKDAKDAVGAYYEVLRPMSNKDLDRAGPEVAAALQALPGGYVPAGQLEGRHGQDAARRALEWACANGMLHKMIQDSAVMGLESARFWLTQLSPPKMRNFRLGKGTRRTYADALEAFDRWLPGREFPVKKDAGRGDGRQTIARRAFADVEDLLGFCEDSEHGAPMARHVVREYLADLATSKHSLSTAMVRCAAVKSYLAAHDVPVDVGVNRKRHAVHDVQEPREMSLFDFYKMMTVGNMGVMLKAIMMENSPRLKGVKLERREGSKISRVC